MSNERTNYGWFNPWGPMTPLMEQWAAAVRMWTDACSPFFPGTRPVSPPQAWAAAPPAVSLEVSSQRPTEVTIDLKQGTELMQLRADSFEPPFRNSVSISHRAGRIHVRVAVANDQPAGEYHGAIRAADGSIVGDLTVAVAQGAKESA